MIGEGGGVCFPAGVGKGVGISPPAAGTSGQVGQPHFGPVWCG